MNKMKKMMVLSVCTALVGTMSAGAVNLPRSISTVYSTSACVALRGATTNAMAHLVAANGCNSTILNGIKGVMTANHADCTIAAKPSTGNTTPDTTIKPSAGNTTPSTTTTKPSAGNTTPDTTTKPSAGNTTPDTTTKPSTGNTTGTTTKPSAGNTTPGTTTKPSTGNTTTTPSTGTAASDSSQEAAIVRLVNEARAQNGLPALTADTNLSAAARVRAGEIRQSFAHTRPDGTSFSTAMAQAGATFRAAGENIAYGQKDANTVMNSWMNSSGHRANILGSRYGRIGVAAVNNGGTIYWVQLFAD